MSQNNALHVLFERAKANEDDMGRWWMTSAEINVEIIKALGCRNHHSSTTHALAKLEGFDIISKEENDENYPRRFNQIVYKWRLTRKNYDILKRGERTT